jgi:hypothetical protein
MNETRVFSAKKPEDFTFYSQQGQLNPKQSTEKLQRRDDM